MALKDTRTAPLTATEAEISAALAWAISQADGEARRVIMRGTGLSRETAKDLESRYRSYRRALGVLSVRLKDKQGGPA